MEGGSYKESASKKANDESDPVNRKSRRKICSRCHRPTPQACVCDALPDKRIKLKKASIVVLQHPHELKMKNRSIPILELCLEKESLLLCVGRRLGEEQVNEDIFKLLKPPNLPILLFPGEKNESDVLNMTDAKKNIPEKLKDGGKIVFIVLDATWKYAKVSFPSIIDGHVL
jgi:DTW domain-containing protein YfiP